MKIVIIGCGTIGTTLLRELSQEDHTITIIDEDKDKVEGLIERYDVFGVVGNGACVDIQREAGMRGADLAVVLTNSDELNVFACLVAKKAGVKATVARVRNPDYRIKRIFRTRKPYFFIIAVIFLCCPPITRVKYVFSPSVNNVLSVFVSSVFAPTTLPI